MKIALLGAGKTGGKVAELHQDTVIFNSTNRPTVEGLQKCDIVISFLTGDVFKEYIPLLLESKLPVVTGSTGFQWPRGIHQELEDNGVKWIKAHNFSLGMNIVKNMIEILAKAQMLYEDTKYSIHDIHHVNKLDAPSGTALSWKEWLGLDAEITAERTGDVVGYHHIEMESSVEKIKITHEAKDRAIFASGAIWAANKLLTDSEIPAGLNNFSTIVKKHLDI